ncbi:hypothetical protein [Acidipropionibacterium timonense]|uniref:hypothetical protein n=1 Tax=Acidipropionibacterium timonense TaxID=2161818 RepID=UPI001032125E|nr:hypothetical protein [Acidipropionibacterium timonense]
MHITRRLAATVAALSLLAAGCSSQPAAESAESAPPPASTMPAASTPSSASTALHGSEPFPGTGCAHVDHVDTTPVTEAPKTRWMDLQGIKLPLTEAGPFVVDGYKQECFAPSLKGAVAAAANIGLRQLVGDPAMTWAYEHNSEPAWPGEHTTVGHVELRRFRVAKVSADGTHVVVYLALVVKYEGDIIEAGVALPVVWTGTDWKTDQKADRANTKNNTTVERVTADYLQWREATQ